MQFILNHVVHKNCDLFFAELASVEVVLVACDWSSSLAVANDGVANDQFNQIFITALHFEVKQSFGKKKESKRGLYWTP
jgi:hypothetical protein